MALALAPGARVTTVTGVVLSRLAARPIWVYGGADTSETPGYPYRVHVAPEVLVKTIAWSTPPA